MVNAMGTGGFPGPTSLAGCLLCSLSFQVTINLFQMIYFIYMSLYVI